ncbi:hypothetical protein Tco_0615158 [Tanacetum coccineum]
MAFVSSPNSTNEVNTTNVQVSTANSPVSTVDTLDSTANLSDATIYAFLANQPNGSQIVHEDLEQIHEDDLEEMDLKWQLALLSMRARRYFQITGKKITINGSDTVEYDKSKVECFNYHKMGHFSRDRGPRNQDNRNRNQDSSRRTVNVEETSSKAMVAIDGASFDWSFMADKEVPTNMALMALLDSEFNKSEFNLATYKRGLASIEEQLVFYKKNKVMFCDQIAVLKRDTSFKDSEINALKNTSNEVNKTPDALLGEKLVSRKDKQTVFPTKIESAKQQEKPARKPIGYDSYSDFSFRWFEYCATGLDFIPSGKVASDDLRDELSVTFGLSGHKWYVVPTGRVVVPTGPVCSSCYMESVQDRLGGNAESKEDEKVYAEARILEFQN